MQRQNSGTGSMTSTSTISLTTDVIMKNSGLEPCAASAKLVLYSQGSSVLCLRHDSLELERRFERHAEEIISLSIDNTNVDTPRVVSVDASKTAIVWDLETGEEFSRFTSYEDIRVASWMKNGNLAFGDTMGNVTLFDPVRSESISARTIFDPLTAIAPGADCRSFALGYQNGSILVAALSPSFTILHTLTTTSLSPSPITTLAWHASSSKQKSDMLAVQTHDGDLRVWSVPKSIETEDSARVVRVLKRPDSNKRGNNWLAWSRNGRIIQYSEGTSTVWDVRTKKVAWEEVPTMGDLAAICVYGAKGALFTFGKDNTVQQYSLYPPTLQANVLHLPTVPPPSPPVSIEEKQEEINILHDTLHTDDESSPPEREASPMTAIPMTPLGRIAQELERLEHMEQNPLGGLGISNIPVNVPKERSASVSSTSSSGSRHKHNLSSSSKGTVGSNAESEYSSATTVSPGPGRKGSIGAIPLASPRKQHPLRQELHISPDVVHAQQMMSPIADVKEIFSFTKERMVTVTYQSPRIGSPQTNMSEDDLRQEMLFCIFGWKGDIEGLISDELESVNARSLNALILRMWLGDLDQNSLSVMLGADFTVSADWLFIALSAMDGQKSWNHVMRAFVMRLLQKNDLHMAVLALLAIGDKNDAVEVYVSHKRYLEAVLLSSLLWKRDWKKISQLVRQWGTYALETHDGTLAARCFACAGTEPPTDRPPLPIRSPSNLSRSTSTLSRSKSHLRSRSENESMSNFARGLSISSPSNPRTTLKMTPKNSPLKLITSFPSPEKPEPIQRSATTSPKIAGVNRFFYSSGASRSACATPIAMSALTPVDPFWQHDPFPSSARTMTPGTAKLPPVTESPRVSRLNPPPGLKEIKISSPIEPRTSSGFAESIQPVTLAEASRGPSPATHPPTRKPSPPQDKFPGSPTSTPPTGHLFPPRRPSPPQDKFSGSPTGGPPTDPLPAPPTSAFAREVSRATAPRKPAAQGLQIQWPPIDTVIREGSPALSSAEPKGHSRKGSITRPSPPVPSGRFAHPPKSPTNIDNLLALMEKGQKRLDSQRAAHRPGPRGTPRLRAESPNRGSRRHRPRPRDLSLERGRLGPESQQKTSHKRSPSSPLPFSPQARMYQEDAVEPDVIEEPEPLTGRFYGDERGRNEMRDPNASKFRSPSSPLPFTAQAAHYQQEDDDRIEDDDEFDDERYYTTSPRPAPRKAREESRGRDRRTHHHHHHHHHGGSHMRSPSSPLPMSPQAQMYQEMSAEVDREHDMQERHSRRPRRRPSLAASHRAGSMSRGPMTQSHQYQAYPGGLRRSRSEKTMKQWSESLERVGALGGSSLKRELSTRGLPSNPRAWRAELQAASRSNSPMGTPRGRSPHMAPAPAPAHPRSLTPGSAHSPSPRNRSPAARNLSPAMRGDGHRARSSSRTKEAPAPAPTPTPAMAPAPPKIEAAIPRSANQYYPSPVVAEYESIGSPLSTGLPDLPQLPGMARSLSHRRNQSAPSAPPPPFEPLIRKLPPQPPPDSPPPLPHDLPVHPALHMHLEPSVPGKKGSPRLARRVKRSNELLTPVDSNPSTPWSRSEEGQQSIVVGIEPEVYPEMMQKKHHKSVSSASSGIGATNQI